MWFPFASLLALSGIADARSGIGTLRKGSGHSAEVEPTAPKVETGIGIGPKRKLGKKPNPGQEAEEAETCNGTTYDLTTDWTSRQGLGESPGIANLEYLGLGYNIFEGNPRGSDISESDPGFRSGVIKLVQQQTDLTIDQEYMVPLGVDLKYTTACKFASKATELSSEAQYRSEISKEASQTYEQNLDVSGLELFSLSQTFAYSHSSKFKEFTETTRNTESVTFEARAMCSEFQASLKPYHQHTLENTFVLALDTLSFPWTNSSEQRAEYSKFLASFGTHYVKDVTLGAKHVFSSEMAAEDVTELSRSEIDVETSLSWSVQASLGGGDQGNEEYGKLPKKVSEVQQEGFGSVKKYTYVFEETSVGAGTSGSTVDSENSETSSMEKVKSKVTTVNEMNIGGNPPEDGNWKTWAATVRDRPMPIAYELSGIWDFITEETKLEAFRDAIVELYGIDLRERKNENIVNALRFGVARRDGAPISSYNRDPSSKYRSNLQIDEIEAKEIKFETTGNLVTQQDDYQLHTAECSAKPVWSNFRGPPAGYYGCGMTVRYIAGKGIVWMDFVYCTVENYSIDRKWIASTNSGFDGDAGEKVEIGTAFCTGDRFISKVGVKWDETNGDNQGIDGLNITCEGPGVVSEVHKAFWDDYDTAGQDETTNEVGPFYEAGPTKETKFLTGHKVRWCDHLGILGLDLKFEEAPTSGGPFHNFYQYDVSREGQQSTVSAIFATAIRGKVGPNRAEDEKLGFVFRSRSVGDIFNIESYYPFGLMADPYRARIAVQDFKDTLRSNELYSFSFLSGDNLPRESQYVAGVVHPEGYPLNDVFATSTDIGYRIIQISNNEYLIRFPGGSVKNPTFIVFPLWFPTSDNEYPGSIGDVVVASRQCEVFKEYDECSVVTGATSISGDENEFANEFLGFSFIALGGDLDSDAIGGIAHGVVVIEDGSIDESLSRFNGFDATVISSSTDQTFEMLSGNGNEGSFTFDGIGINAGILITFAEPFRGLPSVIVSPIIGEKDVKSGGTDELSMPYGIVEHITEEAAFVKANWVDTIDGESSVSVLSFHVVIVGPQRDAFSNGAST